MPDGKTHEIINVAVLLIVLSVLSYIIWEENSIATKYIDTYLILVFSMSYLFATFFLSPDLDINSTPYKRWKMLRILWWPYKVIFKHRGFSHHPIIGPLSIILNLAVIVAALLLLAGVEPRSIPSSLIIATTAGMVLSIEVHIVSDSLVSKMKSMF
ncbi:MAG: metal-binding protein [Methanolobus sp.]|nr:metal-binding protein [Methanolobus sp.]